MKKINKSLSVHVGLIVASALLFLLNWVSTPLIKLLNNPMVAMFSQSLPENITTALPENGAFGLLSLAHLITSFTGDATTINIIAYFALVGMPLIIFALGVLFLIRKLKNKKCTALGIATHISFLLYSLVFIIGVGFINSTATNMLTC